MTIPETIDGCWSCAYYQHGYELGECHRNAPVTWLPREDQEHFDLSAFWPCVDVDNWCGEFVDAPASRMRQRDALDEQYAKLREDRQELRAARVCELTAEQDA